MNLKELYGTESRSEIFDRKHHKKQQREYSVPSAASKIDSEECAALCKAVNLEYLPGYESRVLEYIITNESTDRYGDIVRASGVRWENYMKNPVMLFAHDYPALPVGNTIKIWHEASDNSVRALGLFFDDRVDPTGRSETVYRFASSGAMKGCSVGFMPIEAYRPKTATERNTLGLGEYGVEFRKTDLLEFSPCSVPANPEALRKSFDQKQLQFIEEHKDEFTKYIEKIDEWLEKAKACDHMNEDGTFKGGFDGCVLHMQDCEGHDIESAKKICGKIAAGKEVNILEAPMKELIEAITNFQVASLANSDKIIVGLNEIKGMLELSVKKIAESATQGTQPSYGTADPASAKAVEGLYDIFK